MKQIKLKDYKYGYIVGMCIIVITAGSAIIRSIQEIISNPACYEKLALT
jgi:hypothetical protein